MSILPQKSRAYIYAKSCGMISRSFIEGREAKLSGVESITEFTALVFGAEGSRRGDAPKDKSPTALERALITKTVGEILLILRAYPGGAKQTPELLVRLIKSYEYADLKSALAAIHAQKPLLEVIPLGAWTGIDWACYPNIKNMLRGTEYEFLIELENKILHDGFHDSELQAALDKHYYALLLAALRALPHSEVPRFAHILAEEISLANCSWALRLRSYYNMSSGATAARLIEEKIEGGKHTGGKSLARDAKNSLNFALDHRAEWSGWRRERFLNSEVPGSYWKCDPQAFQHHASVYLYNLARKSFRRNPWTLDTAACFIRLKQFEEQLLCGIAEGLALGVHVRDSLEIMGVAR